MVSKMDDFTSKLNNIIPGGAHTYSKGFDQFPSNAPAAIQSGCGSRLLGIDGKSYIDWAMGLTSVSLGHGDRDIVDAVYASAVDGTNFSRPAKIEFDAASLFLEKVAPFHHMVKFTKNGSTATTAAIKLARAFTGRECVAVPLGFPFFSYDDWFIGGTEVKLGTQAASREQIFKFEYGDISSLENLFQRDGKRISAVIMEPVKFKLPPTGYLKAVKELCEKNGSLFILDEMWCGAKIKLGGGQEYFDVTADLSTWGKGIANGFSCCALSGKREYMELGGITKLGTERVFLVSTTHGAESTGLAAMMATIKKIISLGYIEENLVFAKKLNFGLCAILKKYDLDSLIQIRGDLFVVQTMDVNDHCLYSSDEIKTFIYQELIKRGILFNGLFYVMASHRDSEIFETLIAFEEVIKLFKSILDSNNPLPIVGDLIKPVFRKYN